MGKVWPIGPHDDPVGWNALPDDGEEVQETYDEFEEPKPVELIVISWRPWRRARLVAWASVAASFILYVAWVSWATYGLFMLASFAAIAISFVLFEAGHRERLLRMDQAIVRAKANSRRAYRSLL